MSLASCRATEVSSGPSVYTTWKKLSFLLLHPTDCMVTLRTTKWSLCLKECVEGNLEQRKLQGRTPEESAQDV